MLAVKGNILVEVDLSQKDEIKIGDNKIITGKIYNHNFREKNPVLALVKEGLGDIKKGMWIVCNYNHFDYASPYLVYDNLFSIPVDEEIFAYVDEQGDLCPLCGNVIVERIEKKNIFDIPEDLVKNYYDRGVISQTTGRYKKGDFIFWLPMSDYEIVYTWNDIEKRVVKVYKDEIVGIYNKNV